MIRLSLTPSSLNASVEGLLFAVLNSATIMQPHESLQHCKKTIVKNVILHFVVELLQPWAFHCCIVPKLFYTLMTVAVGPSGRGFSCNNKSSCTSGIIALLLLVRRRVASLPVPPLPNKYACSSLRVEPPDVATECGEESTTPFPPPLLSRANLFCRCRSMARFAR